MCMNINTKCVYSLQQKHCKRCEKHALKQLQATKNINSHTLPQATSCGSSLNPLMYSSLKQLSTNKNYSRKHSAQLMRKYVLIWTSIKNYTHTHTLSQTTLSTITLSCVKNNHGSSKTQHNWSNKIHTLQHLCMYIYICITRRERANIVFLT